MRIFFDNNSFAYLSQYPQQAELCAKLEDMVERGKVKSLGSTTLLEELSGLAQSNMELYLNSLSKYEKLTKGRILLPHNQLIQKEVESKAPLSHENSTLEEESVQKLFKLLKEPHEPRTIFDEVYALRQSYKTQMDTAYTSVLSTSYLANMHRKKIMALGQEWFNNFETIAQDWFVELFNIEEPMSYAELPHVNAFLNYTLTRLYEKVSLSLPDQASDLYDRAYFTEAAAADIFITNDNALIRTSSRVPGKSFKVIEIEELTSIMDGLFP